MRERPILFKIDMVRAILDGRKTQTRRVVKPARDRQGSGCQLAPCEIAAEVNGADPDYSFSPYGYPGDRLWVRETWQGPLFEFESEEHERYRQNGPEEFQEPRYCAYRATDSLDAIDDEGNALGWRPSIFMPRWASRITLDVTGVRVERLQDIGEADAAAEGVDFGNLTDPMTGEIDRDACEAFEELWESINGPGSWAANPWVWVVNFKRAAK